MVFAHGFGCDLHMWRYVAPAFEPDHRVVLFDHVGAGGSDLAAFDADRYATLDGYAGDVLEICAELGLQDVVFVGHSVSAMIGVLAAVREPSRFAKLVLVGPSPRYVDDDGHVGGFSRADIDELLDSLDSNYLGWSRAMAPVIMGRPDRPVAAAYRPAGAGDEVGGDFYDVFGTRGGAWVVVLGDVGGKGAEAAAVTALARYPLRATAIGDAAPARVLEDRADEVARAVVDEVVVFQEGVPRDDIALVVVGVPPAR
jgi:pimeloyl-ACP methyl ester carboxylesterase